MYLVKSLSVIGVHILFKLFEEAIGTQQVNLIK